MFETLKRHLPTENVGTHFFFGLTEEELKEINELLKNNYGFLDITIDFADSERLETLVNSIPENLSRETIAYLIYEQYLYYQILRAVNSNSVTDYLGDNHTQAMEAALLHGDIDKFLNLRFVDLYDIEQLIPDINTEIGTRMRLHLMLDNVDNPLLQKAINSLVAPRFSIVIMGYTSKEGLLTAETNTGSILQDTHEYIPYHKGVQKQKKYPTE